MSYKVISGFKRFKAPTVTAKERFSIFLYRLTGYRNSTYLAGYRHARQAWHEYAASIQKELDSQRARGFGFRAIDGARVAR